MPDINIIRKIAETCYHKLIQRNLEKLELTNKGLTELERLDIYQMFRDKTYDRYGQGMFFEDFCDIFDRIYHEIEEEKTWESLVMC